MLKCVPSIQSGNRSSKFHNANEGYCFIADKEEITITLWDMFRSTFKLPVEETPEQPSIPPATLEYIHPFLKIIDYQGFVIGL
ncbi:hypothetical protein Tco_0199851 [Tanacetum coccineum]